MKELELICGKVEIDQNYPRLKVTLIDVDDDFIDDLDKDMVIERIEDIQTRDLEDIFAEHDMDDILLALANTFDDVNVEDIVDELRKVYND